MHSCVLFTMTLTVEPMSRFSPVMVTLVPPAREPFLGSMDSSFGTWIQHGDRRSYKEDIRFIPLTSDGAHLANYDAFLDT